MRVSGIIRYTSAAGLFALVVCCIWIVFRILSLRGRKTDMRREGRCLLTIAYLSALIQITGLRIGLVSPDWLGGSICLFPLQTTINEARAGLWPLVYHVIGNMIWFVPLGMILPGYAGRWNGWWVLLCGMLLSLGIEILQYLLGTGISDIDDILLNGLGTLAGYGVWRLFRRLRKIFH